jgi:hypothetical protein
MNIFSRMKRRVGYFILDYIGVKAIAQTSLPDRELQERLLGYLEEPPPYVTNVMPSVQAERHTDGIDERAENAALQAQKPKDTEKVEVVRGRPLDISVKGRAPGEVALWYWDKHRDEPMGEMTQEYRAVRRTDKLENRGKQK